MCKPATVGFIEYEEHQTLGSSYSKFDGRIMVLKTSVGVLGISWIHCRKRMHVPPLAHVTAVWPHLLHMPFCTEPQAPSDRSDRQTILAILKDQNQLLQRSDS